MSIKTHTTILLFTLLLLGGCSTKFERVAFSDADIEYEQMLKDSIEETNDFDTRVLLGRFYFEHNDLERANRLLKSLIKTDASHMEALAWYGANKCKIVAESNPWFMGLRKLYRVKSCLGDVKTALDNGGDNFNIKLIGIHTGSGVNMFGSLDWAGQTHQNLSQTIKDAPGVFAPEAIEYFNLASADYYQAIGNSQDAQKILLTIIETSKNSKLVSQASKMKDLFAH